MAPEDTGGEGAPEPDETPNGPPPDPLDRPWVHPSELRSFVSAPDAPPREARPREWAIGLGSAVAAVVVTVLVLVAFGALGGRNRSPIPPPVVTSPNDVIDYAVAERIGGAVAPSVVTVRAGNGDTDRAVGSGVVLTSDRVVTTSHVLNGATEVSVVTNIGEELPARLIGSDAQTDLALLAVSDRDLQLARFGPSVPLGIGEPVVAVSAARGGLYRIGIDVVSDRDAMVDAGTGIDVAGLLETGIAVTPGMAGAALVDADGNLVGILTRAAGGSPDGLAIPVATVRDVLDQLDGSGKVAHGWMGVLCDDQPAELADGRSGARVLGVFPDGPAAAAGLQAGDVIVRAEGRAVRGMPQLVAAARSMRPQDPLDIVYVRDGRDRPATVTLEAGDPQRLREWPAMG